MVRTLIQPIAGTPAPLDARPCGDQHLSLTMTIVRATDPPLRQGIGLMIATGASLGLWAGLAKLVLAALR